MVYPLFSDENCAPGRLAGGAIPLIRPWHWVTGRLGRTTRLQSIGIQVIGARQQWIGAFMLAAEHGVSIRIGSIVIRNAANHRRGRLA
jgi:hypothetical protein